MKAMDLDEDEDLEAEIQGEIQLTEQEDNEYSELPDEWVFTISQETERTGL